LFFSSRVGFFPLGRKMAGRLIVFPSGNFGAVLAGLFPYGKEWLMEPTRVRTVADLGAVVRRRRKEVQLTQAELAEVAGVGVRFVSELERGKPTAEMHKVLQVLSVLGVDLQVMTRGGGSE
jgi:y4mF family transcriptional regulator